MNDRIALKDRTLSTKLRFGTTVHAGQNVIDRPLASRTEKPSGVEVAVSTRDFGFLTTRTQRHDSRISSRLVDAPHTNTRSSMSVDGEAMTLENYPHEQLEQPIVWYDTKPYGGNTMISVGIMITLIERIWYHYSSSGSHK